MFVGIKFGWYRGSVKVNGNRGIIIGMPINELCYWILMAFKCKKCNTQFEEKNRWEIHKKVHDRKSKVSEYGSPGFNDDRLRGG